MTILAIETSSPSGGVALISDGEILGEVRVESSQGQSRETLTGAEKLLSKHNLAWKDLSAVAASHGPGSFTGVRIGLTLVKGLAWSLGIPCVTVSSLEVVAHGAHNGEEIDYIIPMLDARIGEVYASFFRTKNGSIQRDGEDFPVKPEELIPKLPEGRLLFAGEGARRYFDSVFSEYGVLASPDHLLSSPSTLARLAWAAYKDEKIIQPEAVSAVYLREATVTKPKSSS